MQVLLDHIYASPEGIPLHVDLFRPDRDEPAPIVLCIHGGGWISGERTDMRPEAQWLAQNGFAAACPSYRLAPLHPAPAAIEDVRACVDHLRKEAPRLGFRGDRIGAWGVSAGGHLAAMLGVVNGSGFAPVQAVVDVCGLTDLTRPREQHHEISWSFLDQFMAVPYEGNESRFEEASPLHCVQPNPPPFLIFHGVDDDVVAIAQSDAFARKLGEAGAEVEYHRLDGELHAFTEAAQTAARGQILRFFSEKLIP